MKLIFVRLGRKPQEELKRRLEHSFAANLRLIAVKYAKVLCLTHSLIPIKHSCSMSTEDTRNLLKSLRYRFVTAAVNDGELSTTTELS